MIKKYFVFISILVCFSVLVGCGKNNLETVSGAGGEEIVVLKFRDQMTSDRIKSLDGKKVQMTGFIATSSPLNGDFIYLMNMPYHQSPYCVPNTNTLANTLTAYAPKGETFKFVDSPITITGTFVAGDDKDSFGYNSPYKLVDSSYEIADIGNLEGAIKEYSLLVNKGFITKFHEILTEAYKLGDYQSLGTSETDLKPIDAKKVEEIKAMFEGLDMSKYEDAALAVTNLDKLVTEMNESLKIQNYSSLNSYQTQAQSVFQELTTWILKYSF